MQKGITWAGFVLDDPTDSTELHLKNGDILTPKKDIMVGYDGREFIYCENDNGEMEWIELGEE